MFNVYLLCRVWDIKDVNEDQLVDDGPPPPIPTQVDPIPVPSPPQPEPQYAVDPIFEPEPEENEVRTINVTEEKKEYY